MRKRASSIIISFPLSTPCRKEKVGEGNYHLSLTYWYYCNTASPAKKELLQLKVTV